MIELFAVLSQGSIFLPLSSLVLILEDKHRHFVHTHFSLWRHGRGGGAGRQTNQRAQRLWTWRRVSRGTTESCAPLSAGELFSERLGSLFIMHIDLEEALVSPPSVDHRNRGHTREIGCSLKTRSVPRIHKKTDSHQDQTSIMSAGSSKMLVGEPGRRRPWHGFTCCGALTRTDQPSADHHLALAALAFSRASLPALPTRWALLLIVLCSPAYLRTSRLSIRVESRHPLPPSQWDYNDPGAGRRVYPNECNEAIDTSQPHEHGTFAIFIMSRAQCLQLSANVCSRAQKPHIMRVARTASCPSVPASWQMSQGNARPQQGNLDDGVRMSNKEGARTGHPPCCNATDAEVPHPAERLGVVATSAVEGQRAPDLNALLLGCHPARLHHHGRFRLQRRRGEDRPADSANTEAKACVAVATRPPGSLRTNDSCIAQ